MSKSQRLREKNEATGMRVVAEFVQEYWECGWQQYEHRNDKGIDGRIIMKHKGAELGASINVQVKCGSGYVSSIDNDFIKISIGSEENLRQHSIYWKTQLEPAILVFVLPSKLLRDENGNVKRDEYGRMQWIENRNHAKAWWVNLKDKETFPERFGSIINIPKHQTFGQHSKGDFKKLILKLTSDNLLQEITLNDEYRKLYNSLNLIEDAKKFYKTFKAKNKTIHCSALNQDIIISRLGWNHITNVRRPSDRRNASFKLLGAAMQILDEGKNVLLLNQTENNPNYITQKFGIKARIKIKNESDKIVQVIILKKIDKIKQTIKYWFYSVHNRS